MPKKELTYSGKFHSNIVYFGPHFQLMIPLNRIQSVTKEKRALLFPTAIHITTATEKYGFSSFIQRDVSYQIVFRLWQNALLNQVCVCLVCVCVFACTYVWYSCYLQ